MCFKILKFSTLRFSFLGKIVEKEDSGSDVFSIIPKILWHGVAKWQVDTLAATASHYYIRVFIYNNFSVSTINKLLSCGSY
jgi:hypothetical protein